LEKVFSIIKAEDFNFALTNLLIDLYSSEYERCFEELQFDENEIENLSKNEWDRLTKVAAIVEYVGNRQPNATLYKWIYSEKLRLDDPYTPGVDKDSVERVKQIFSAPKEFSLRNVFFEEETLKPI
jgi:hypothetical protein